MESDIIYHYTSPEGLKNILESHSLRFTDYRFLNDKNEGLVINKTNCIETKIKELLDKEKDDIIRTFLKKLQRLMNSQTSLEKEQIEKIIVEILREINIIIMSFLCLKKKILYLCGIIM